MMGTPANEHPRAFWRADREPAVFDAAVAAAVEVVREVRPQVVVTYDDNGDYGHPDHIMAHRVATAAADRAADPGYGTGEPWAVTKFYWTATPKSVLRRGFEAIAGRPTCRSAWPASTTCPSASTDDVVTTAVDATGFGEAKLAALAAHRTQITVESPFFALSNMLGREALAVEYFRLVRGEPGGERDADGRERDLFAGLAELPAGAAPEPPVDACPPAWPGPAWRCSAWPVACRACSSACSCRSTPARAAAGGGAGRAPRQRPAAPPGRGSSRDPWRGAPAAGWLAVVVGFGVLTRPEGDVILPGGTLQWVTYAMVLGGGWWARPRWQ